MHIPIFIRKVGSRILVVLISILLTLLLLEIGLRIFLRQQLIVVRPDIWVPSTSGISHVHQANLDTSINTGERTVRLITDTQGYRIGAAGVVENPEVQLLAVGDSFIEAFQVEYEDSVTALLETRLAEDLGQSVRIINTGVAGYGPSHYYILSKQLLASQHFDMVLVFIYVANDIESEFLQFMPPRPTRQRVLGLPKSLTREEVTNSLLFPVNDFLEANSHLYVFFKDRGRGMLVRLGLSPYYFPDPILTVYRASPDWEVTADIFQSMAQEAVLQDVPIMFVLIPAAAQIDPAELEWRQQAFQIPGDSVDLDQPSTILSTAFAERNLILYDSMADFQQAYRSGVPDLYGRIDNHLGIGGHEILADAIYSSVLNILISDSQ